MATLIQNCTSDPISSDHDDALSSQFQNLSLKIESERAPLINAFANITIKDKLEEEKNDEFSAESSGTSDGELLNDKVIKESILTKDDENVSKLTDESCTPLNTLEKDSLEDASSFEPNLDEKGYSSDENNESPPHSDDENEQDLNSTQNDSDGTAKKDKNDRKNADDPESFFIKRGPVFQGHCYNIPRFNPMAKTLNGYGGSGEHHPNGYNEISLKQEEFPSINQDTFNGSFSDSILGAANSNATLNMFDNCETPRNANWSPEYDSLADFKPLEPSHKLNPSNYTPSNGYSGFPKQGFHCIEKSYTASQFDSIPMNDNLIGQIQVNGLQDGSSTFGPVMDGFSNDGFQQHSEAVDIWNQFGYSVNHNSSPEIDSPLQYQPPTPPKSVSPNPKNQDPLSDELIELITVINKGSQGNPMLGHEEALRRWRKNFNSSDISGSAPHEVYSQRDDNAAPLYEFIQDQHDINLNEFLETIDVGPTEMDIYLHGKENKKPSFDFTKAHEDLLLKCNPQIIEDLQSCITLKSKSLLSKKDDQGDSAFAIGISKKEDVEPKFYEIIYSLQEMVKKIYICCDKPIGKSKKCKVCHNANRDRFYTPMSFKNKDGDTPLSCSVRMGHSDIVISYLLSGLLQCPEDVRREFDQKGKMFYSRVLLDYPLFKQFLK